MKKEYMIGLLIVVLIIIFTFVYKNKNDDTGMIKIGAIAPLTGWGAYWGEGYIKGIQLAVDDIKSKGGNLSVVIEDGGTDAKKSADAAQKLISIDKVKALTVEFTGPTSSVSPISLQNKIPLVYDSLVKKFVDENKYSFKMYFDVGKQCYVAAQYLADHGYKNIGGFSVNLDFAQECKTSIEKVAQEKGIKSNFYMFNMETTDYRTLLTKVKGDGVDAMIPVFYEDNAVSFFKQKSELSLNIPVFMGIGIPDGFTEKVRASIPQSSIEGVMTFDKPVSDEFKSKIKSKYPKVTESDVVSAAYGYDEIMYLYTGLSKCSGGDSDCVISKVEGDNHIGAFNSNGFGSDRIFDMSPIYYKYVGGKLEEFSPLKKI